MFNLYMCCICLYIQGQKIFLRLGDRKIIVIIIIINNDIDHDDDDNNNN